MAIYIYEYFLYILFTFVLAFEICQLAVSMAGS